MVTYDMLLLLLSGFSRVQLCAIPQTATQQAPPALGFSRQEYWSGLPYVLAIVNSTAVNTEVHVSFSVMVSSVHMPSSRIAGSLWEFYS